MATQNPTPKKAVTPPAAAKTRTCAVNTRRWSVLVPDQPECTRPLAKPTAALCQRHEKMLPAGWRKLFNEYRAARRAEREAAKAKRPAQKAARRALPSKPLPKKRVSAKARRDAHVAIVARLESEGATTSDAQGAADVEVHERGLCDPKTCPLHRMSGRGGGKPPTA